MQYGVYKHWFFFSVLKPVSSSIKFRFGSPYCSQNIFLKYNHYHPPPQTQTLMHLKPPSGSPPPTKPCIFGPLPDFPARPLTQATWPALQPHRPSLVSQYFPSNHSLWRCFSLPTAHFLSIVASTLSSSWEALPALSWSQLLQNWVAYFPGPLLVLPLRRDQCYC